MQLGPSNVHMYPSMLVRVVFGMPVALCSVLTPYTARLTHYALRMPGDVAHRARVPHHRNRNRNSDDPAADVDARHRLQHSPSARSQRRTPCEAGEPTS